MAKTEHLNDALKAILIWRDLEVTNDNINNINNTDITCNFKAFPKFAILRNKSNIEKYRKAYSQKTNKQWQK